MKDTRFPLFMNMLLKNNTRRMSIKFDALMHSVKKTSHYTE
jgi:hypothetical protein